MQINQASKRTILWVSVLVIMALGITMTLVIGQFFDFQEPFRYSKWSHNGQTFYVGAITDGDEILVSLGGHFSYLRAIDVYDTLKVMVFSKVRGVTIKFGRPWNPYEGEVGRGNMHFVCLYIDKDKVDSLADIFTAHRE